MKKGLAMLVAIAAVALFAFSLPSTASASDKDCSDFPSQKAAQIFYLKHGGPRYDPDRLDADRDGIACEDNPCPCYSKKHLSTTPRSEADLPHLAAWAGTGE